MYSDWPSYPQLYVRGDLVGGCDIVEEMDASGELEDLLKSSTSGKTESLQERLQKLVTSSNVMLFMKVSPSCILPVCVALLGLFPPCKTYFVLSCQVNVVLVIQGSPQAPRCGFSSKVLHG